MCSVWHQSLATLTVQQRLNAMEKAAERFTRHRVATTGAKELPTKTWEVKNDISAQTFIESVSTGAVVHLWLKIVTKKHSVFKCSPPYNVSRSTTDTRLVLLNINLVRLLLLLDSFSRTWVCAVEQYHQQAQMCRRLNLAKPVNYYYVQHSYHLQNRKARR